MSNKEKADKLCREIESHSPMVLDMSIDERAQLFKAVQEAIPIAELLDVAEAAENLEKAVTAHLEECWMNDRPDDHPAVYEARRLLKALRAKLPKEML